MRQALLVPPAVTRMWQALAPTPQERYIIEQVFSEMHPSEAQLRIMIDTIPALAWSCLPDGANEFTNQLARGVRDNLLLRPGRSMRNYLSGAPTSPVTATDAAG